jgi:PAS domain S-box-containing protein
MSLQKIYNETLLKALSDLGEGLLILEDGHLFYCNEAFCEISGYSMTALAALPTIADLAVPQERFALEEMFSRLRMDNSIEGRCETAIRHASGRRVELEVAARLLEGEGQRSFVVALVRDITGRKRMEEALTSATGALLALHEAGRVLASTLELEEMGRRLLEIAHRVCGLEAAVLHLLSEKQELRALCSFGRPSLTRAASDSPEGRAARRGALKGKTHQLFRVRWPEARSCLLYGLFMPLQVKGRVIGVLECYTANGAIGDNVMDTLECLVGQSASALDNARLYREVAEREEQLEELVGKLLAAQEQERRRIAHDLHDGLTQVAIGTHQSLQAFAEDYPPESAIGQRKLDRVVQLARQTVRETRHVIADLRPLPLDDFGLAAALRLKVRTLQAEGWEIEYDESLGAGQLPAEIETTLYRVAQEALTNVRKHAHTRSAAIMLTRRNRKIFLRVTDEGCGFDQRKVPRRAIMSGEHVGLLSMQERIALVGGECRIYSEPGVGTSVMVEAPLPVADEGETRHAE